MNKFYFLAITFFYFLLTLQVIADDKPFIVNKASNDLQLLSSSKLYIDYKRVDSIDDILKNKQNLFKEINEDSLGFGYSPDFNVWIKVTLHNNSLEKIDKVIEYANPLTTDIEFYDPDKNYDLQYGGFFHKQIEIKTLNSIFYISLKPKESKTYYIKTFSRITPLIVELKLWDQEEFYNKELSHQMVLALFFGAMFILAVYNLFIYFFTQDRSYLFYVIYIIGLIFHHLLYVGFANVYFFNIEQIKILTGFASLIVAVPVYALGLFTKSFLETQQYKIHNKILNLFLIIIPLSIVFFLVTEDYNKFRNLFSMLFLVYLFYVTVYAFIKKNKQANFIIFGWFVFVLSGMLMFLSSAGVFSVYKYFPYLIEVSFLLEAVIFSIALANRINCLQQEKNEANQKLILQKKEETIRLEQKVQEKTKDLTNALSEKEVLLKELNHRVKNNMQTILSLIRLQSYEVEDTKFQSYLQTIQNRIAAMSHLHELLFKQENLHQIQTTLYFQTIVDELQQSYTDEADIVLNIKLNLETEEAIYCGLIVNELVTNSIKYAFSKSNENPRVTITLYEKDGMNYLEVADNGCGYDTETTTTSLGMTLVETLSLHQLDGEYTIDTSNGTKTTIVWKQYGQS